MTETSADRSKLAEMLEQLDYVVEADSEKGLRIRTSGVHVTIVVYDDGSLSLVCSVAGGPDVTFKLDQINEANNRVRFAKFSIVDDTLHLEADFVFALNAPTAFEQLRRIMQLWHFALQELRNLVRELVN